MRPAFRSLVSSLLLLCAIPLTACSRATPERPDGDAKAASETTAPTADSDVSLPTRGADLVRAMVRCEAVEFMQRNEAARRQGLLDAGLRCESSPAHDEPGLHCALPPATRAWGDALAERLRIVDRDGMRIGIVALAADARQVRAAIEGELGMQMDTDADGVAVNHGGLDDMYRMRLLAQGAHRSELQCLYAADDSAAAQSAQPDSKSETDPDQDRTAHAGGPSPEDAEEGQVETPPGSIEGAIRFPDTDAPALRICALQGDGRVHRCIDTAAGATSYRIERVPAGDYVVIAQARSGSLRVGGHVQQVQCIRAPCPAMPAEVFVPGGGGLSGIDINGFYEAREDFPTLPSP